MTSTSIYQPITPTYLYIKQHSLTGMKYFGKTIKDPYKYNGSGKYWTNHIKKHGREHIKTLWVSDLYHDTSIVDIALKFSFDNNIVESNKWANLEQENGLTGGVPGRKLSAEHKANISAGNKGKKQPNISASKKGIPQSAESNAKRSSTMTGVPKPSRTAEHSAKISAGNKGISRGKGVPKPKFLSIIETRKTYTKARLSQVYPEFKQYF